MARKRTGPALAPSRGKVEGLDDVPAQFRPNRFRDEWLSVVPLRPDETDERHCSLAYGLSVEEVDRERSVGRKVQPYGHWRTMLAAEARERAYTEWLGANGLLDDRGHPLRGWSLWDHDKHHGRAA